MSCRSFVCFDVRFHKLQTVLVFLATFLTLASSFIASSSSNCLSYYFSLSNQKLDAWNVVKFRKRKVHSLRLVPLSYYDAGYILLADRTVDCDNSKSFFDEKGNFYDAETGSVFQLGLAEHSDLPDLARFIVACFGADAIRLSQNLNTIERMIVQPAVELVNGYSGIIAFAEVLAGLRQRLSRRQSVNHYSDLLSAPFSNAKLTYNEKVGLASRSSVVLMLAKNSKKGVQDDGRKVIIATVEVRLEPCDAKIPFSLPWLDDIERELASLFGVGSKNGRDACDLQPYLSNLCVDESYRGRGIAKAMVQCVEHISHHVWGYKRLYLHVDKDNKAALTLYRNAGYRDVGIRWNPFWAGKAAEILYFVKRL